MRDHRDCCPELYPPEDWQDEHPGEAWRDWYMRTRGVWWGFLSPCCGWPMEGMAYGPCIHPSHLDEK